MKKLIILALLVLPLICRAETMIGRVAVTDPAEITELSRMGFGIYNDELPGLVDLVFDEAGLLVLKEMGYVPTNLTPLPQSFSIDIDPEYHTYEELTDELQALAAQYPDLCRLDSIGHATQFPRTIWCMKLSDNAAVEEDELSLFYLGTHHGSEALGLETTLYMINNFLENYGIDPQITQWMNDYEIFFVPLVNPDGHYAVTSGINEFWRKNARDINQNGIYYEFTGGTWWTDDTEGIDLNRNYNWYWNLGGSSDPWAYNYRGASPFSEDELQCIRNLAFAQRFVCGISFHSYGEVIIYPWTFNLEQAPDQDVLDAIGLGLAEAFIKDNGGSYSHQIENGKNGQCRNWFYGFAGALAYCVEVNPYPIFLPPGHELAERTERYAEGAVYLLERLAGPGITGHVTDATTGLPLPARVEIQGRISDQVRPRFAEPQYGRFTRLLNNGTYTVLAGMRGYQTVRIPNIAVNDSMTELEIQLTPVVAHSDNEISQDIVAGAGVRVTQISGNSINFTLELVRPSEVDLTIYNVMGREVAKVSEGYRSAGMHQLTYNASGLASGVYIYLFRGSDFTSSGKMVLMK